MLTLKIPRSIPATERRNALQHAKRDARRHQIIMQHTAKRGDLGAFQHAKIMFDRAAQAVNAWESVQLPVKSS